MSMLVVIRNIEEMDTALEAANKYVIFMQKLFDSNQQENWILGVWVRSGFETGLPFVAFILFSGLMATYFKTWKGLGKVLGHCKTHSVTILQQRLPMVRDGSG